MPCIILHNQSLILHSSPDPCSCPSLEIHLNFHNSLVWYITNLLSLLTTIVMHTIRHSFTQTQVLLHLWYLYYNIHCTYPPYTSSYPWSYLPSCTFSCHIHHTYYVECLHYVPSSHRDTIHGNCISSSIRSVFSIVLSSPITHVLITNNIFQLSIQVVKSMGVALVPAEILEDWAWLTLLGMLPTL